MAYHTATTPSPRYPENYASQGKLVTSLSIALGVYVVLSLSLFIVQLWYALATNHVIQLTDDAAELLFVSGTTVHWLHDGFDAACCAVGLKFVQRASQNARVLGAFFHLRAAHTEGGSGPRTALARYYIERLLPELGGLIAQTRAGADGLYALSPEDLAS